MASAKVKPTLIRRCSVIAAVMLALSATACSAGGAGREVTIVATDTGCSPAALQAAAGETLTFVVRNEAKGDRELEGIEGTRLEEVLVPAGRTRRVDYRVPAAGATQKLKCYIPGGPATIIELSVAGATGESQGQHTNAVQKDQPFDTAVYADLDEWSIWPSVSEVKAGRIKFVATNLSPDLVHEMAVLSVDAKGKKRAIAEIEGLMPGETGELVVKLRRGSYQLACLIAKGEEGSPEDHYQKGMYIAFTVR